MLLLQSINLLILLVARTAIVEGSGDPVEAFRRAVESDDVPTIRRLLAGAVVEYVGESDPLEKFKALKTLHVDHHSHASNSMRNGLYTLIPQGPEMPLAWELPGSEWQVKFKTFAKHVHGPMSGEREWW